ncbi:MAG: caspase family protein, partial [Pirellulaceae bacterium]
MHLHRGKSRRTILLFGVATILSALAHIARCESVAFVVGVESYDPTQLRRLDYAKNDAIRLGQRLELMGFHVLLLTEDSPNPKLRPRDPDTIIRALEGRLRGLEANDTLLVAFSGHGVQFEKDESDADKEVYFCPELANLEDRG